MRNKNTSCVLDYSGTRGENPIHKFSRDSTGGMKGQKRSRNVARTNHCSNIFFRLVLLPQSPEKLPFLSAFINVNVLNPGPQLRHKTVVSTPIKWKEWKL